MTRWRRSAGDGGGGGGGHGKHGVLAMIACCIPMVAVLLLIVFKVI